MTRPITLTGRPGRIALMPRSIASRVRSPRSRTSGADVAGVERRARVAVHAADVRGDVDLDDVAVLERAAVRDAVADDLVHARAQRLAGNPCSRAWTGRHPRRS